MKAGTQRGKNRQKLAFALKTFEEVGEFKFVCPFFMALEKIVQGPTIVEDSHFLLPPAKKWYPIAQGINEV